MAKRFFQGYLKRAYYGWLGAPFALVPVFMGSLTLEELRTMIIIVGAFYLGVVCTLGGLYDIVFAGGEGVLEEGN